MKSSPKRAVQTSPSITFYTHKMFISFFIILFVAKFESMMGWDVWEMGRFLDQRTLQSLKRVEYGN